MKNLKTFRGKNGKYHRYSLVKIRYFKKSFRKMQKELELFNFMYENKTFFRKTQNKNNFFFKKENFM